MTNPVVLVRDLLDSKDAVMCRSMWLWCPGCNLQVMLPVPGEDGRTPTDRAWWQWDGNVEMPTLSPSILQHEGGKIPRCHSYLKAGRWEFLSDCTHPLAGQTVDMVPLPDWMVRD